MAEETRVFAPPLPSPLPTPDFKGEETITMEFKTKIILQLPDYQKVEFGPGLVEVPKSLSTHPYLVANGVQPYRPRKVKIVRGVEIPEVKSNIQKK